MSGQLDLFGAMSPALAPGMTVSSHGQELTFDEVAKRVGGLVIKESDGTLTVCRVEAVETVSGSIMYQKPRKRISLYRGFVLEYVFRSDRKLMRFYEP